MREEVAKLSALLLSHNTTYQSAQHIACYMAYQDEALTQPLIEQMWQDNKSVYLPVLSTGSGDLVFHLYSRDSVLTINQFGIKEPTRDFPIREASTLDMVIMPLIAFDDAGNRLGTGGGYYDRTFEAVKPRPFMLGYAYSIQQAPRLPADPWDIPMDGLLTELALTVFHRDTEPK